MRSVRAAAAVVAAGVLIPAPAGDRGATSSAVAASATNPRIEKVRCATRCASHRRVRGGGEVTLAGKDLSIVRTVVFLGGGGRDDDVAVKVTPTSDTELPVPVPYFANSGPLSAFAKGNVQSNESKRLTIVSVPAPRESARLTPATGTTDAGAPSLETAVSSGLAYVDGSGVKLSYRVSADGPASVKVSLVELPEGSAVRSWTHDGVAPGETRTITWHTGKGGKPATHGRYGFRVAATGPTGAVARNTGDGNQTRNAFDLHGYTFPLHAAHRYGQGFGVPRPGHTHKGVDVFANCGTPIVAPRGGVVKANNYQGAAGNYLVIDGADTGYDFFFAHMTRRSPLLVHQRVLTGQKIGDVGQTGDAVGCHLHFEMWTPPGWFTGGHAFDPLPFLKAWDGYS